MDSDRTGGYARIDECLQEIRTLQMKALTEIQESLGRRLPSAMVGSGIRRGVRSGRNVYRNHVWLSVTADGQEFWITAYFMDVDSRSGNIHSQLGRVQFWRNVRKNSQGAVSSPNRRGPDGRHFMFCPENSFDPGIRLYDEEYSPDKVAEAFVRFLMTEGQAQ